MKNFLITIGGLALMVLVIIVFLKIINIAVKERTKGLFNPDIDCELIEVGEEIKYICPYSLSEREITCSYVNDISDDDLMTNEELAE